MEYQKIQKHKNTETREPCKFNKHLLLREILQEIFFEKMLLEFDKSFNVIVKEFMFSEAATGGVL